MLKEKFDYQGVANRCMDHLKDYGYSGIIATTGDNEDGYYRVVVSPDGPNEKEHIIDLLNCMAQAAMALRARLDEINEATPKNEEATDGK